MPKYSNNTKTNSPVCPYYVENDIELNQILEAIKREWRIYLFIIIFFAIFSIIIAFFLPKQYLVQSVLLPPTDSSVNRINIPEYYKLTSTEDNFQLTGNKLYLLFLDNLRSSSLRYQFFNENHMIFNLKLHNSNEYDKYKIFNDKFNDKLNITYNPGSDGDTKFIKVELYGRESAEISNFLNKYVDFVDKSTVKSVEMAIKSKIFVEKDSVSKKISSLRMIAEKNKKDILYKIVEDLKIAEELNLIEPANISFSYYSQSINSETGAIENTKETPGYLKGVNILRAELNSVKNRKNNDPFIPGLQKLLEREEYLDKVLKLTFNDVHAARIDKIATPPLNPAKPVKLLVIAVGIMFGVLISTFILLLKNLLTKRVETHCKA